MPCSGLSHAFHFDASSNFVVAIRNTFITVEEEQPVVTPKVRRHSWSCTRSSEVLDLSGAEGDESDFKSCDEEVVSSRPSGEEARRMETDKHLPMESSGSTGCSSEASTGTSVGTDAPDHGSRQPSGDEHGATRVKSLILQRLPLKEFSATSEFESCGSTGCSWEASTSTFAGTDTPGFGQEYVKLRSSAAAFVPAHWEAIDFQHQALSNAKESFVDSGGVDGELCLKLLSQAVQSAAEEKLQTLIPPGAEKVSRSAGADKVHAPLLHGADKELPEEARMRPTGQDFHQQVLLIVEDVGQALRELQYNLQTHACLSGLTQNSGICTLTAKVPAMSTHYIDSVVDFAQKMIYSETKRGRGVCLLGYRNEPFKATTNGFNCKVATPARKRQACRDLYAFGRCQHPKKCYWEHPQCVTSIHFVVELIA